MEDKSREIEQQAVKSWSTPVVEQFFETIPSPSFAFGNNNLQNIISRRWAIIIIMSFGMKQVNEKNKKNCNDYYKY